MIYLRSNNPYYTNMITEMTDRELISLVLNQKDNDALETLITRHHPESYKKINNKLQDEHLSVDLCKKLWVCVFNNPGHIESCDNFDKYLDTNIDFLLKNEHEIIENLLDSVHLNYQKNSIKSDQPQTEKPEHGFSDLPGYLNFKFGKMKKSSYRLLWLGLFAALILTVVFVINLVKPELTIPNTSVNLYESDLLKENPVYLADNINTNIDWQYGFVIEGPDSHDAFVAGSYMIDLVNLNKAEHPEEIKEILNQLEDINTRIMNRDIQNAIEYVNLNTVTVETVKILASAFENFYNDNSELKYFKLGKWVEFNYLHSKLAIVLNNSKIYSDNLIIDNKFITEFLTEKNHLPLLKKDIEQMQELSTDKNISLDKLKKQLVLLENLRSLLF